MKRFLRGASLLLLLLDAGWGATRARDRVPPPLAGQLLSQALEALRQAGLKLVYSSDLVRPELRVLADATPGTPREMAEQILAPHGLALRDGPAGTLLVVRREETGQPPGGIRGRVRIRGTSRPVPAAVVLLPGTSARAVTDRDGRFLLPGLPAGTYALEVRVPGLRTQRLGRVVVEAGRFSEEDLEVAMASGYVERIAVSPDEQALADRPVEPREVFPAETLRRMAQVGGDLQRSVSRLPGAAGGDKSAAASIRGGDRDETQVLLDGLEIVEPFHLEDFLAFSGIIDSDAVGTLNYLSGGFPARYSGRMSGVLELTSKEPAAGSAKALRTGPVNSGALSEGSSADGGFAWLAAGRGWYPDAVFDLVDPGGDPIDPVYYDFMGKSEFRLEGGSILAAHVLFSHDGVSYVSDRSTGNARASATSGYLWLTLLTPWTPRLSSSTVVSAGRGDRFRKGLTGSAGGGSVAVHDSRDFDVAGARQEWTLESSGRSRTQWGFTLRRSAAEYDYTGHFEIADLLATGGGAPVIVDRRITAAPSGYELGGYVSQRIQLGTAVSVEGGARWDRQTWTSQEEISPRLNLVVSPRPRLAVRAAWGRFFQPQRVYEVQVPDGETGFHPAQLSEHRLVSLEWLPAPAWRLRADVYAKEMSHLRPRYENLFDPIELFPEGEGDRVQIAPDRAEARGLELFLEKRGPGRLGGWAGYTLARVDDLQGGKRIPRSWDQRHAFSFSLNYGEAAGWNLNLAGTYHSGWPTTGVSASVIQGPGGTTSIVPVLGARNGERYPPYYRLDLEGGRTFRRGDSSFTLYAEITNLTNRKNVCCVEEFEYLPRPGGGVAVGREAGYWLERVPSAGFLWRIER